MAGSICWVVGCGVQSFCLALLQGMPCMGLSGLYVLLQLAQEFDS